MPMNEPQKTISPLEALTVRTIQGLEGIFFDFDDTFTTHGKIPACSFAALWDLKSAGIKLILVTGRPAGWCDHIARMWPVDGVVGENGALYFWYAQEEGKLRRRFFDSEPVRAEKRERLLALRQTILAAVPGCAVAGDQLYRESDLAIDYCEDVPPLGPEAVSTICEIFRGFAAERLGLELDRARERFAYCGDSPNDEPLFGYFPVSVGVRNVLEFAARMETLPRYLTSREGGEGFAEFAAHLLRHRRE
jgi:HAD superfamily hydrolase (TIGR01484 family)